ncbi:MAG: hypothetical protein ABI408_10600 [Gemmatimonadaceae bacterium]
MHRTLLLIAAALAATTVACASKSPGIQITSSDFDLNPLVGEWRGDYRGTESGRTGTIAFTLRAGDANASGNVVMIPRPADSSAASEAATGDPSTRRQVLSIHFVRKEGGNVVGTLDPYGDPECACQVTTTFQGKFTDTKTIEGTYTTVPSRPGTGVTTGSWKVTRLKRL